MATVYSDIAALHQAAGPRDKSRTQQFGGRVRIANGVYEGKAADAAGTKIVLVKLPAGARLLPSSRIYAEAGQAAALALKVGDAKNNARYLATATVGAAAKTLELAGNALAPYNLEGEQEITAETSGAALAAGKKIAFELYYVID